VDKQVFSRIIALFQKEGGQGWFSRELKDLLPDGTACAKCGKTVFKKEEDILDVWFDSGVSWVALLKTRDETKDVAPRDVMYLEGSDQHRGWFQTSLLPAVAVTGKPPYGRVLTHGFVLDGEGRAMSKSLGNVISPQEIVDKYGADVLRLWVAMTDYREDVRLSQDILNRVIDTYRKVRNTLRFLLGNLGDFELTQAVPLDKLEVLDRAVLGALNETIAQTQGHYDRFQFHLVSAALADRFCVNVLSEYALDILKDVLYCDRADSHRRRSAQTTLLLVVKALARILAPILSFTAEETWQTLQEQKLLTPEENGESVFLNPSPLPVVLPQAVGPAIGDLLQAKGAVNEAVEKLRQAGTVKGATDAHITVLLPPSLAALSTDLLTHLLGVSQTTVAGTDKSTIIMNAEKAGGNKCLRCWIWRELDAHSLCHRCAEAEIKVGAG
jgi:isoleucyl-tRNA synthetase